MKNIADGPGMPLGLGMALAQNTEAMQRFARMTSAQQNIIIQKTHGIRSKAEMQAFVESLID